MHLRVPVLPPERPFLPWRRGVKHAVRPLAAKRPVAAAFVFFFLLPARPQSWRTRPCQGGTHCVQWGGRERPALTWPRRDYIALLEEEEKRRSNGQRCFSAARGRAQLLLPRRQGGRAGEGARARSRCPRGTQPGSKRPIERHSAAARQGSGGAEPPGYAPAHASSTRRERALPARAVPATDVHRRAGPHTPRAAP